MSSSTFNIDFEQWVELAQRDPQAFFSARQALIEDFIASVPPRHQADLRRLQSMIDASRVQAGTPINAVRDLMMMIGEHLEALQGQLVLLRDEAQSMSDRLLRLAE